MSKFQLQKPKLHPNQLKKLAKEGISPRTLEELRKTAGGIPLNSLAMEYLFGLNVFPLQSIVELFGEEATRKSTILMSWLERYGLRYGADTCLINTENKQNLDLTARLWGELQNDAEILKITVQEKVQQYMLIKAKAHALALKNKKASLALIGLDSYRVVSQVTVDKVLATGNAERDYSVEANLWRKFLSVYLTYLNVLPLTVIVVNHATEDMGGTTGFGGKVLTTAGGRALKFYEEYRFIVKDIGSTINKSQSITNLMLKSVKNSSTEEGRKVYPRVIYRDTQQSEDIVTVDWDHADAMLLIGPDIPRTALKEAGVCDVVEGDQKGYYSDKVTGLKNVPITEIIQGIYKDKDKLDTFRKLVGICVLNDLDRLWDNGWFFKGSEGIDITTLDKCIDELSSAPEDADS